MCWGFAEILKNSSNIAKVVRRRTEYELRKPQNDAYPSKATRSPLIISGRSYQDDSRKQRHKMRLKALIVKFKPVRSKQKPSWLCKLNRDSTGLEREAIENELNELLALIKKLKLSGRRARDFEDYHQDRVT